MISHHFAGGIYAKETRIPAGFALVQHMHTYDHLAVLASGRVVVDVDGEQTELVGPACLTIKAGKHHGVVAVSDVVWYCIHATDCTEASEVDAVLIRADSPSIDMGERAKALRSTVLAVAGR